MNDDKFALWCEKYRPAKINDCVLTPALKKNFNDIIKGETLPNMLLCGTPGTGKTTIAKAVCKTLDLDYLFINASEDNGIDILRNKIRQYASSVSLTGGYKVVILDEADSLTPQIQTALRGFIEEFSSNCRFFLTCNYKNKLIEPLHSRFSIIEFNTSKKDLAVLAGGFMARMSKILKDEGVKFDEPILADLIIKHAPDWRRIINECQRHSVSGELSPTAVVGQSDESISELVKYLKEKDFKSMRGWVANNISLDGNEIIRKIYDSMTATMKPESIPQAVLILADYGYKLGFCVDKELAIASMCVELMSEIQWK